MNVESGVSMKQMEEVPSKEPDETKSGASRGTLDQSCSWVRLM